MERAKSREATELNANHDQMNPGFGTGFSALVVTHESAMAHEPAKGAFNDPAARQHGEAGGGVRALDDFDFLIGVNP